MLTKRQKFMRKWTLLATLAMIIDWVWFGLAMKAGSIHYPMIVIVAFVGLDIVAFTLIFGIGLTYDFADESYITVDINEKIEMK